MKEVHGGHEEVVIGNVDTDLGRRRSQNRKCKQHAQRIQRMNSDKTDDIRKQRLNKLNTDTIRILEAKARTEIEREKRFAEQISEEEAVEQSSFFHI